MVREFIKGKSMLAIHRYLRGLDATLIRMTPKRMPNDEEAYVVLYIKT
jgi:hypothetical protein